MRKINPICHTYELLKLLNKKFNRKLFTIDMARSIFAKYRGKTGISHVLSNMKESGYLIHICRGEYLVTSATREQLKKIKK